MNIQKKAKLVARTLLNDNWSGNEAMYDARTALADDLSDYLYDIRDTQYRHGEDPMWANESWEGTFLRYVRLRRVPKNKVDELFMRVVLAGLHNGIIEVQADD